MFISNFIIISLYGNTIRGIILNDKKQPIEFANITLFKPNDSLPIATTLSDSLGVFTFSNVSENNYIIEISYLGYVTDTIKDISIKDRVNIININNRIDTIIGQDNTIQLNEIQLKLNSTSLNEIQVTATKPIYERKADRIIFNVENSVYSQGSDAMQTLSKAPRVQVQNDEIKIAGRGDAAVLINDRLVRMSGEELSQYLKSIPSSDIQKIEVIPNPPAKYDAQGAALINIVLKKNKKQGYNGSIIGSFTQAQYQGGSLGLTFNYTKKNVSINSSITNQVNKGYREEMHVLKYSDETWRDTTTNPQLHNSISGKIGLNININSKSTLGFNYIGFWRNVFWDKEHIITWVRNNSNNDLLQNIKNNANNKRSLVNHSFSSYYTLQIDTIGKKLDIGFDFFNNHREINRNYSNAVFDKNGSLLNQLISQENTNGVQNSYISTINLDMEHPVKYGIWQYGGKFTFFNVWSNNEQSVLQTDNLYYLDTSRSSLFVYKELNEAIYVNFNKSFKKLEFQAGLRLEFTQLKGTVVTTGNINSQQYIRPFPSLMLQYKINEKNQLNFSTNSRIDRPLFNQLNPFRYYYTQFSYTEGNPYLQPLYSYNFSLEYILKQNYSFSLYYNYSINGAYLVKYTDTTNNTNFSRWESGGRKIHDFGTYNQFNFNIKNRWDINTYINAYIDFLKSPYLYNSTKRKYWGMELGFINDFIFDKHSIFTGNLSFYFQPPGRSDGEETFKAFYGLDLGFKAKLLKEKNLVLSLFLQNILKTYKDNASLVNKDGVYYEYRKYYNDRFVQLSITYKFGNQKIKNKEIKNNGINNRAN